MDRRTFLGLSASTLVGLALPLGAQSRPRIGLGIDVLAGRNFAPLRGKRVGLLTHPAGVNAMGVSTIDVLRRAPQVQLVALFGPEHGIYGDEKANVYIPHRTDRRTGLPAYSLYDRNRRPTPEMLAKLDVMVVDLQDLGVRSYTYVSAMRYTIEECFRHGVEVVILDRPNPIGGLKVDGPPLERRWMSYVGAFQVPYVHGLTIGELAEWARRTPGGLELDAATIRRGRMTVIPMSGWRRSMMWTHTGLRWIPTSPAIPDLSAAMGYSMTGLGTQLGGFRHGYGTRYPFRLLQHTGRSPEEIAQVLSRQRIPGLGFKVVSFSAERGQTRRGAYVLVKDWNRLRPTEISFHMMRQACAWSTENPFAAASDSAAGLFNKHVGSTAWWEAICREGRNVNVESFVQRWAREARTFQERSRRFWLYA